MIQWIQICSLKAHFYSFTHIFLIETASATLVQLSANPSHCSKNNSQMELTPNSHIKHVTSNKCLAKANNEITLDTCDNAMKFTPFGNHVAREGMSFHT